MLERASQGTVFCSTSGLYPPDIRSAPQLCIFLLLGTITVSSKANVGISFHPCSPQSSWCLPVWPVSAQGLNITIYIHTLDSTRGKCQAPNSGISIWESKTLEITSSQASGTRDGQVPWKINALRWKPPDDSTGVRGTMQPTHTHWGPFSFLSRYISNHIISLILSFGPQSLKYLLSGSL